MRAFMSDWAGRDDAADRAYKGFDPSLAEQAVSEAERILRETEDTRTDNGELVSPRHYSRIAPSAHADLAESLAAILPVLDEYARQATDAVIAEAPCDRAQWVSYTSMEERNIHTNAGIR